MTAKRNSMRLLIAKQQILQILYGKQEAMAERQRASEPKEAKREENH